MLVRGVIGHQVEHDSDAAPMGLRYQPVKTRQRAEVGMHVAVVADIVAPVFQWRRIDGAQPDRIDAEQYEILKMRGDAVEVADAVAIRIRKTARIDLVEDRVLPPITRHRSPSVISPRGGELKECSHLFAGC